MYKDDIVELRKRLNLNQIEFGGLFGVHPMTVSKWERGTLVPNNYQIVLMQEFLKASRKQEVQNTIGAVLLGAGIAAALLLLLKNAEK